jgi:hypothetical protein
LRYLMHFLEMMTTRLAALKVPGVVEFISKLEVLCCGRRD